MSTPDPEGNTRITRKEAHKLLTPLTIITGEAELTLRLANSREEYRESLEVILEEARRLTALITELSHPPQP